MLYAPKGSKIEKIAGPLYATDLAGSCAGALLTASFFIPLLGLPNTLFALSILNGVALVALVLTRAE